MSTSIQCAMCGAETPRRSPNQKYCPVCARKRGDYRPRASGRKKRSGTAKEDISSLAGKSLSRVAAEAAALGLQYGEYTVLVKEGMIERWCRERGVDWRKAFEKIKTR